jgi:hypothetical protein
MKTFITCILAIAGIYILPGCISVKTQRPANPQVTTTTTEQTTSSRPHTTTVETKTLRY